MRAQLGALTAVLASPVLRRVQLSWLFTSIAEWGAALALAIYALREGGAAAVGVMALVRTLPAAPVAPIAALVADRVSRRQVLLLAALGRALATIAIAGAALVDAPLAVVYVLVGLLALAGPAVRPAFSALLPRLSRTPGELAAANAVASIVRQGGFLIGSVAAGALLVVATPATVLALLGGCFALGALLLVGVTRDEPPEAEPGARPLTEIAAGARLVAGDTGLLVLVLIAAALALVDGALDVLVVVAAIDVLDAGEAGAGALNAMWGLGATLGGAAVVALLNRRRLAAGLALGAATAGASLVLAGLVPTLVVTAAALLVFGVGFTLAEVIGATLVQRLVPDHLLGRVTGVMETAMTVTVALGGLGAGLLAQAAGARVGLVVAGGVLLLLVLVLRVGLRRLDEGTPVPEREFRALREHPIFAPLPIAETERLAGALTEVRLDPGDVVMREGDAGDRFALIVEGEVGILAEGVDLGVRGPGEGLGEIALLRDTPRTATVTARTPMVLLVLERAAFLAAVGSQAPAGRAANRIADRRLPR